MYKLRQAERIKQQKLLEKIVIIIYKLIVYDSITDKG